MREAGDGGARPWGDPQDKGSGGLRWAAGRARTHLLRALSRFSRIWGSSPFRTVVFTNSSPVGVLMNWSSVRLRQRTAGVTLGPPSPASRISLPTMSGSPAPPGVKRAIPQFLSGPGPQERGVAQVVGHHDGRVQ